MSTLHGSMSRENRDGGWELIVGFGHAVYGAITPEKEIITFIGWHQSSNITRDQIRVLRSIADKEFKGRPKVDGKKVEVRTKSSDAPNVFPASMITFVDNHIKDVHTLVA